MRWPEFWIYYEASPGLPQYISRNFGEGSLAVKKMKDKVAYEIAIPWKALGVSEVE